jgi:ssDNA-binding Zn-finger/Zn-ribbon topoisomerase 1
MSNITKCKFCEQMVAKSAPVCPHCGGELPALYVLCPDCGSLNMSIKKKGFSFGRAVIGEALIGPAGLLAGVGTIGDIEAFVCNECGRPIGPCSDEAVHAMFLAIKFKKIDILKELIEQGVDVNSKSPTRRFCGSDIECFDAASPLAYAKKIESSDDIIKLLIEHGATTFY